MRKVVFVLFAVAGLVLGCTSVDCSMNNTVAGVCAFQAGRGDSLGNWKDSTLSVVVKDVNGKDSMVLNKKAISSNFYLPVSYTQDVDEFRLLLQNASYNTVAEDTIRIEKTNDPIFESVDCALRYHHKVGSVTTTKHFLDSIVVNNDYISNDLTKVHFYLYLHPSDKSADSQRDAVSSEKD